MTIRAKAAGLALRKAELALVRTILREHAPAHKVFAFGSRAYTQAQSRAAIKAHADLDLLFEGPSLNLEQRFALREAFSESDLPMRVDVVEAAELPAQWEIRAWPI